MVSLFLFCVFHFYSSQAAGKARIFRCFIVLYIYIYTLAGSIDLCVIFFFFFLSLFLSLFATVSFISDFFFLFCIYSPARLFYCIKNFGRCLSDHQVSIKHCLWCWCKSLLCVTTHTHTRDREKEREENKKK